MRKTKNKWMTVCCGRCGKAHCGYTGKLDKDNVEYVVCEETHKRMNVSPIIDSKSSVRYQTLYPTEWVLENGGIPTV
jgi:hypothetical protein